MPARHDEHESDHERERPVRDGGHLVGNPLESRSDEPRETNDEEQHGHRLEQVDEPLPETADEGIGMTEIVDHERERDERGTSGGGEAERADAAELEDAGEVQAVAEE